MLSLQLYLFIFDLFIYFAESTSVGQHREAGKVITETGGRLPDSSRNWYVFFFGLVWEGVGAVGRGFKIVVKMSERQQIVSLICGVGIYVYLVGVGGWLGLKKPLSLTSDDIFGCTSKVSQEGKERDVQATD